MFNTILNWSIAAILASFTIMPISFIRQTAPTVEPITEEAELKGCAVKVPDGLVQFIYDHTKGFSEQEVTDKDNWFHDEFETATCSNDDEVACVIRVSPGYVDQNNPEWKLDPGLILIADEFQDDQYHITGSSNDIFMVPINKELEL